MPFQYTWERTISGTGTRIPAEPREYYHAVEPSSSIYLFDLYPPFRIESTDFSLVEPYAGGRTEIADEARVADDGTNKLYWRVGRYPIARYSYYSPLATETSVFTLPSGATLLEVSADVDAMSGYVYDPANGYQCYNTSDPTCTLSGSNVYLELLPTITGSHGAYITFNAPTAVTGTIFLGQLTASGVAVLTTANITGVNTTNFTSPYNVGDGLSYTYWSGNTVSGVGNPKLQFDYVSKESPEKIRFQRSGSGAFPASFKVNVGDSLASVVTVYSGTLTTPASPGDWTDWISINSTYMKYRYWELEFPGSYGNEVYISEIEFNRQRLTFNITSTWPVATASGNIAVDICSTWLPTSNGVIGVWCSNDWQTGKLGGGPTEAYTWSSATTVTGTKYVSLGVGMSQRHPAFTVLPLSHEISSVGGLDFSQSNPTITTNVTASGGDLDIHLIPQGHVNNYTLSFKWEDPQRNLEVSRMWEDEQVIRNIGFYSTYYAPNVEIYVAGGAKIGGGEHVGNGFYWIPMTTPISNEGIEELEIRMNQAMTGVGTEVTYDLVPHYIVYTTDSSVLTASSVVPHAAFASKFPEYNTTSIVPDERVSLYLTQDGSGVPDTSGSMQIRFHLTGSGTAPVEGGCDTCSGSHYAELVWSIVMDNVSGTYAVSAYTPAIAEYALQTKTIGDAIGINPNDIRYGLLAWHPLEGDGPYYEDRSGNNRPAYSTGQMEKVMGKHGYASSLSEYPYNHLEFDLPQQTQDYMVSFWFKPTKLLTSGTEDYFTVMESEDFYGDHFKDSWNYLTYPTYKGWTRLNSAVTCSAGYQGDYLRLKGNPATNWMGSTWTSSTVYFDIPKSQDWNVEIKFDSANPLSLGQAAGFIFFNQYSYLKYCSLIWQADLDTDTEYIDSSFTWMTGRSSPSPQVISESSKYSNNEYYAGWHTFQNPSTSWGNEYFHSGSGSLPEWVMVDMGAGTNKVIQGYRLRRRNVHLPKDWVFQASVNGTTWITLHTMVNQPDLSDGTWTSWFYFTNYINYRYYRFYVTRSQSGTSWTCWDGTDLYVKEVSEILVDCNISVQTEDLSYIIEEHASTTGPWLFEMQKRGDYVWFNYRHETAPGWSSPIYRMDVSLWGEDMRLGLQSRNPLGEAPEILFDYFKFKRGKKPSSVGDPENPGRVLVTYNQIDANGLVEERTDSRLWVTTGHEGHTYGTARYRWEPDQWYLVQFGLSPNADYAKMNEDFCWWVNAKQERGIVVESGTGAEVFIPSGSKFNYFDSEPYTTNSGSFALDEVSHWNRWLTAEEILKMWNRVSQISWHKTEPYLYTDEELLSIDTTESGGNTLQTVTPQIEFDWNTQYQAPWVPQQEVQLEKISYRIQKDLRIGAWKMDTHYVSIFRRSSGWIANNLGCYCLEETLASGTITSASSNKVYTGTSVMYLVDNLNHTLYRTGAAPPTNLMFSYGEASTWWKGIRFRSFGDSTYWDDDFPKDIKVYGSNKDNPVRDTSADWTYEFQIRMSLPSGANQWSPWVTFPKPILYRHYKLEILNNTNSTGNWISLSEMQIDGEGLTVPTIYAKMDVRGDVAVYTQAFNYPETEMNFYAYSRLMAWTENLLLTTTTGVDAHYTYQCLDSTEPRITYASPQQNSRMNHPGFLWFPLPKGYLEITEFGNTIDFERNRVWMKRNSTGYSPALFYDNFCFYSWDLSGITASGAATSGVAIYDYALSSNGWSAVNYWDTEAFTINKGFSSILTTEGYGSELGLEDPDGIDDSLTALHWESRDTSTQCLVYGDKTFSVTVTGTRLWSDKEHTAPYLYFTVPSGILDWEVSTRVRLISFGPGSGQYAGITVSDPSNPSSCIKLLSSNGKVYASNSLTGDMPLMSLSTGLDKTDSVYLKLSRNNVGQISLYWSEDNDVWNQLASYTFGKEYDATPSGAMTSPYYGDFHVWASSENTDQQAYKLFDKALDWGDRTTTAWKTGWRSAGAVPQWVALDFGANKQVTLTSYKFRASAYEDEWSIRPMFPRNWLVQGSNNGTNWTTVSQESDIIGPCVNRLSPSENANEKFYIQSPGLYRYYRFYFTQGWHPDNKIALGEIFLWASTLYPTTLSGAVNIGPMVSTDAYVYSSREGTEEENPLMTSNYFPLPYLITAAKNQNDANHPAWHAFDGSESTYWNSGSYPTWIQIDLGTPRPVMGFRFKSSDYTNIYGDYSTGVPDNFTLRGSNNGTDWVDLDWRWRPQPYTSAGFNGQHWYPYGDSHYICGSTHIYRYIRFQINTVWAWDHTELYGFKLLFDTTHSGGQLLPFYGSVTAEFDWFKLTSTTSGVQDLITIGDGWELLLDGETPINTLQNSGFTTYDRLDDNKFRLGYEPIQPFDNGDEVFIRVETCDEPSLNLYYDGYENDDRVRVYIPGEGPVGVIADYRVNSVSGTWLHDTGGDAISQGYPASGVELPVNLRIDRWETYNEKQQIDSSIYKRDVAYVRWSKVTTYSYIDPLPESARPSNGPVIGTPPTFTDEKVIHGSSSIKLSWDGSNYNGLEILAFKRYLPDVDWQPNEIRGFTVHGWFYFTQVPTEGIVYRNQTYVDAPDFDIVLRTDRIELWRETQYQGKIDLGFTIPTEEWVHIAIVISHYCREDLATPLITPMWATLFWNGKQIGSMEYMNYLGMQSTYNLRQFFGMGINGYCSNYAVELRLKWFYDFVIPNVLDEIYTFKIADWLDYSVDLNVIDDVEPPVCVPVAPLPNASGVCPASGIVFDILDDYTGVNWDHLVVQIDNITVWSGGNNMTDWYDDRGTLVYEDRGRKDGEWEYDLPQGASGTVIVTDGINRQLYPPGTVYSGSGAWGRRFTYYVDGDTEIHYFDYHMDITITGTDNRGYLSQFDDRQPNTFGYEYGFDFITNDNIQMGNFFLDVGESERIDILKAQGRHIWVDLWDTDYPTTDIQEDECYLRFYDGVENFVCSGTWWTTYTGTAGTASGILVHRLHYDAGDYYWDGHRTMHWEVHAQNNNPTCHVYNRDEYQLLYGWHLFWLHHDRIPPFEFDKKLPVFVSIKTQDYVPSRYSKSYMIWTAPAGTSDFNVGIKALPLGAGNEVEVDLIAHSHYLQYSEDVEVEVTCKDRDGNELLYSWTFTTEDEPEN